MDAFSPARRLTVNKSYTSFTGSVWGKRKALQENITCKHCGAVTEAAHRCGCPEAVAQLKADDDASNKKNKEDNARYELSHARFEKERADKRRSDDEAQAKDMRQMFDAGRKRAQRTKRVTDLEDRELAQKEKAMARRESHQEAASAEATEPEAELTFASFGQEVTLAASERLPSAFVRSDDATLLYEGVGNSFFGEPSSCKSFTALMVVIRQLRLVGG